LPASLQQAVFPLLAVGFGVIAPMWPLHSWSPVGHAAAPSAVSMLHAGVLMKLGSYAILRLAMGLLPEGAQVWMPWIAAICVMNIIYGGFVAMSQRDLKLLIGYSSSSHMGYVLLGIACLTPLALNGAVLLMFAHGLMTALAFALVGHVYDETHTRYLPDLGGLAHQVPFIAACGVIAAMASSGLPGFANFVAELLVFVGGWDRYPLQVVCGVFGAVITGNSRDGIKVNDNSTLTVSNTQITGNGTTGLYGNGITIWLGSTANLFQNVAVTNNGGFGLACSQARFAGDFSGISGNPAGNIPLAGAAPQPSPCP